MKFRIATIVILIAVLVGCNGAGPTEPTTPVPEPTETPTQGCPGRNCHR
jgi:hypothetical protein